MDGNCSSRQPPSDESGPGTVESGPTGICQRCSLIDWAKVDSIKSRSCDLQQYNSTAGKGPVLHETVELGSLEDVQKRRSECPVCALIFLGAKLYFPDILQNDADAQEFRLRIHRGGHHLCGQDGSVSATDGILVRLRREPSFDRWSWFFLRLFPQEDASSRPNLGRIPTAEMEYDLVKHWFRYCCQNHGEIGDCDRERYRNLSLPPQFRLIDVDDGCIVKAPEGQQFVALSYIWGTQWVFRTLKENLAALQMTHGLSHVPVPATIRDAMSITRRLGYRYLWVDSICIVQDSREDKESQIPFMDTVYAKSVFTIIAADAVSAHSGLPGVSAPRHVRQHTCEFVPIVNGFQASEDGLKPSERTHKRKLSLALPSFPLNQRETSAWNKRAWTFQEELMAGRALFATTRGMVWRCDTTTWTEDIVPWSLDSSVHSTLKACYPNESNYSPHNLKLVPAVDNVNIDGLGNRSIFSFPYYSQAVKDHSRRNLTMDSDIINAFTGLLRFLQTGLELEPVFLHGLPEDRLHMALHWQPLQYLERRSDIQIPTWSWAAWKGQCGYLQSFDHEVRALARFHIFGNSVTAQVRVDDQAALTHPMSARRVRYIRLLTYQDTTPDEELLQTVRIQGDVDSRFDYTEVMRLKAFAGERKFILDAPQEDEIMRDLVDQPDFFLAILTVLVPFGLFTFLNRYGEPRQGIPGISVFLPQQYFVGLLHLDTRISQDVITSGGGHDMFFLVLSRTKFINGYQVGTEETERMNETLLHIGGDMVLNGLVVKKLKTLNRHLSLYERIGSGQLLAPCTFGDFIKDRYGEAKMEKPDLPDGQLPAEYAILC